MHVRPTILGEQQTHPHKHSVLFIAILIFYVRNKRRACDAGKYEIYYTLNGCTIYLHVQIIIKYIAELKHMWANELIALITILCTFRVLIFPPFVERLVDTQLIFKYAKILCTLMFIHKL